MGQISDLKDAGQIKRTGPLHYHPADGGYYPECKRGTLERAAPELLQACKEAFAHSDHRSRTRCKWTVDDQMVHELLKAAISKLKAAISKAEA